MALSEVAAAGVADVKSKGHLSRAFARLMRKKVAVACLMTLAIVYSAGIFAAAISPYGYRDQDYTAIRKPPSLQHWAGTDLKGRDVLTRTLWGIQNTVIITVVVMATGGLVIGVTLGLVSGYFGRRVDSVIMRTGEVFSSFPEILLMIILAATLRPRILEWVRWVEDHTFLDGLVRTGVVDYFVISIALVSFGWISMARLVRGQVLYLKETQFVESAKAIGASTPRILFGYLLPNAISPIVVTVSMSMGALIGTEIILSFLGLGIQPPRPSLGTMLLEAGSLSALREVPWMLLAPSIVAWTLVLAWNLLGDALNDVLNPRTR
ncbi:MAG: ABC transporter permease [Chloroflexi bacterium]|nr:ABC transporter permease [Chloroflexota bacterium]